MSPAHALAAELAPRKNRVNAGAPIAPGLLDCKVRRPKSEARSKPEDRIPNRRLGAHRNKGARAPARRFRISVFESLMPGGFGCLARQLTGGSIYL
jgi:hypothetical protein